MPIRFGADQDGDHHFCGMSDSLAIHKHALSAEEVLQLFASAHAVDLVASWQFGDNSPRIVQPLVGNIPLDIILLPTPSRPQLFDQTVGGKPDQRN